MKNKRLPTVSIGIPAHNEGQNIKALLQTILRQECVGFTLKEILVISDGSNDNTLHEIRSTKDKRIKMYMYRTRLGKTQRINQLCEYSSGDMLILMDADIVITDAQLLKKVVGRINVKKYGLICINARPLPGHTFFERCINFSAQMQEHMRKEWDNGRNYLAFKGCFMVLSSSFAKTVNIPKSIVNNDAYLYFDAKRKGYKTFYNTQAVVFYKSPSTFKDHLLQSSRFQTSKIELSEIFSSLSRADFAIPKKVLFKTCLSFFLKNPLYLCGYVGIFSLTKLLKVPSRVTWEQALSTKSMRYE